MSVYYKNLVFKVVKFPNVSGEKGNKLPQKCHFRFSKHSPIHGQLWYMGFSVSTVWWCWQEVIFLLIFSPRPGYGGHGLAEYKSVQTSDIINNVDARWNQGKVGRAPVNYSINHCHHLLPLHSGIQWWLWAVHGKIVLTMIWQGEPSPSLACLSASHTEEMEEF